MSTLTDKQFVKAKVLPIIEAMVVHCLENNEADPILKMIEFLQIHLGVKNTSASAEMKELLELRKSVPKLREVFE